MPEKKFRERISFPGIIKSGGGGWIRTIEAVRQQIYSLPHLTALELLHKRNFTVRRDHAGPRRPWSWRTAETAAHCLWFPGLRQSRRAPFC